MIRAAKGGPLGWLLDRYVGWKFRSSFRGLWVRGALPAGEGARLVYVNHSSWWDGFVLHQLGQVAGWDAYCLMEEKNLRRYRFLARLGAFSIRPGEPASAMESLRYARELMRLPGAAVCLFPEGELRPFGVLPLRLQRGVELLARTGRVECVPVALRYAFFEHERPDVLVEVGTAHSPGPLALFQERLEEVARRVAAATSLEGFTQRVAGGSGVAERWDAVRGGRA
ncbi:lysophospholipid acyltransferase family protein [Hyalangium sp.]|uniref:lysophospholipid acyltransferase family protein n=1 Tax=Hyalangium sp. TaxID=2028555 RepID=UPI002D471B00|nr:lysophospholipid acyltransferase family protein [Hyalangium sp.]HYI03114.1 lysophospholipid acyltransferase family protein [Hyalangium sp.]